MAESTRPKALLPLLIAAGVLALAIAVVLVWMLNRPADAAGAPASPSASTPAETPTAPAASPTPTPTPTEPAEAAVTQIVLGAGGFDAVDAAGETVFSFAWDDEPTDAVASLEAAFGSAPEEDLQEGDQTHFPDYTLWRWPGFELGAMVETPDAKSRDEYPAPGFATLTANTVGAVEIVAEYELAIGAPVDVARAAVPDNEFPSPVTEGPRLIIDQDRSTIIEPGESPTVSIIVEVDGEGEIATIRYAFSSLL